MFLVVFSCVVCGVVCCVVLLCCVVVCCVVLQLVLVLLSCTGLQTYATSTCKIVHVGKVSPLCVVLVLRFLYLINSIILVLVYSLVALRNIENTKTSCGFKACDCGCVLPAACGGETDHAVMIVIQLAVANITHCPIF